ncbi:MAG: hypothetical protein D6732_02865 [Methanobacteriota archaeon]|nr:MAG: hypothetical protein D6732_02865 [Euryarchaeota archaeon]
MKSTIPIEFGYLRKILDSVSSTAHSVSTKRARSRWFRNEDIRAFHRGDKTQFRTLIRNKAGFEWSRKRPYSFADIILVQGRWRKTRDGICYQAIENGKMSYNSYHELRSIQSGVIVLFVTACIKQNLHDMTFYDALAEGVQKMPDGKGWHIENGKFFDEESPVNVFSSYWDASNRKNGLSWNGNPKVWVTSCIPIVV